MADSTSASFTGSIPENYDRYLGVMFVPDKAAAFREARRVLAAGDSSR